MNNKNILQNRKEELAIFIEEMLISAQDVKTCYDNNYKDLHSRILDLEGFVRKMVIRSHQIKDLEEVKIVGGNHGNSL